MGISDTETTNPTPIFERSRNELIEENNREKVINIPVRIDEHSLIDGARQVLDVLRPTWHSDDIHFKVRVNIIRLLYNLIHLFQIKLDIVIKCP